MELMAHFMLVMSEASENEQLKAIAKAAKTVMKDAVKSESDEEEGKKESETDIDRYFAKQAKDQQRKQCNRNSAQHANSVGRTKMNGQPRSTNKRVTPFHLLQWNAHSIAANGREFFKFLSNMKLTPSIICIQETWLDYIKEFVIEGFESHRIDRADKRRGEIAIFVAEGISFRPLQVTSNTIEIAAVEVFSVGKASVCATSTILPRKLALTRSTAPYRSSHKGSSPLLCGDLNSHHVLWDRKTVYHKGIVLAFFIKVNNLVRLNDGSITFSTSREDTVIHSALDLPSQLRR